MTLIAKPFITIYGVDSLCEKIEKYCITSLAMEPIEWKRDRGSEFKQVHVDIDSKRFNESEMIKFGDNILNSPLFHVYVIQENEELYAKENKELFSKWIGCHRSRSMKNWNVLILIDSSKTKTKFSLNKFSLLNKLKLDFNITNMDDHFKRLEDNKDEIEQIQTYLREMILNYYDTKCRNNEEKIRKIRENSFNYDWDYFEYFLLQEELADIYECLSLYDEALAQFDETNCVFSKCISKYEQKKSKWLDEFRVADFSKIDCLNFTNFSDPKKHCEIQERTICLPDFRAYLLSRQCAVLQMLNRFKEIPNKVYLVLIEFLNECRLLDMEIDCNLKNCWIYLTGMQALQRFSPVNTDKDLAQSYSSLLRLSLNSVNKLAEQLKIWDKSDACDWSAVDQLREKIVVLNNEDFGDTPSSKLNAAFRDRDSFRKFHIDLYEETITIWKHVERMRSAAFLGAQLADLYFNIGKYELAEPLYMKAIKCLRNENWAHLAMPLRLKLAVCQKQQFESNPTKPDLDLLKRYLKTCVHLAGGTFCKNRSSYDPDLFLISHEEHAKYLDELMDRLDILFKESKEPYRLKLEPLFQVLEVGLMGSSQEEAGKQVIRVTLESFLSRDIDVGLVLYGMQHGIVDLSKSESCINNEDGVSMLSVGVNSIADSSSSVDYQFEDFPIDSPRPGVVSDNNIKLTTKITPTTTTAAAAAVAATTTNNIGVINTIDHNNKHTKNKNVPIKTTIGKKLTKKIKLGSHHSHGTLRVTRSFEEEMEDTKINEEVVVDYQTPKGARNNHKGKLNKLLSPVHEVGNVSSNDDFQYELLDNNLLIEQSVKSDPGNSQKVSVQCNPKYDAGQIARRISISNFGSIQSGLSNIQTGESETRFIPIVMEKNEVFRIKRGINEIRLISEKYGFYSPTHIEISLFNNKALSTEYLDLNTKFSSEWTDKTILNQLLPKFIINEADNQLLNYQTSFVDFDNLIQPSIQMGALSFCPILPWSISIETNSGVSTKSTLLPSDGSLTFKAGEIYKIKEPMKYRVDSSKQEIRLSLDGIISQSLDPISVNKCNELPRKLHLSHNVICNESKYIISIELQPSSSSSSSNESPVDTSIQFFLKNQSLRLHHNENLTQLLKLLHHSLANGKFSDQSKYVLLWILDSSDVSKDSPRLQFTLNIDLKMSIYQYENGIKSSNELDGSIEHKFFLNI